MGGRVAFAGFASDGSTRQSAEVSHICSTPAALPTISRSSGAPSVVGEIDRWNGAEVTNDPSGSRSGRIHCSDLLLI